MLRDDLLGRFPLVSNLPPDCWIVGGAVRDLLLGIEPADVDVACDHPLACARAIAPRAIRLGTGDHLSAWRVVAGEHVYDFAEILDHDIDADLARRDFTINAIAVRVGDGATLDPHGGRQDLERGIVRMIAAANFDDDPLRCLKAVRMAIKFGFDIDRATIDAIRPRAPRIGSVAAERVTFELSILFSCGRFGRALALLRETGLDVPLFGTTRTFASDDVSVAGAYALLVDDPRAYAKRWRWSTDLLRQVTALQHLIDKHDLVSLYDAGEDVARQLPAVLRALGRDDRIAMPDFTIRPLLKGDEIGLPEGKELGRVKRALLEAQIRGEVRTREEAQKYVECGGLPPPS